jgi:hypothetical protein
MTTLKPSSANYWKGTAFSAVFLIPLIGVQFALNRERSTLWLILLIVVPLCLAGVALYFARARIFISDTHIGKQSIIGTRWTPKADFDRALLVRGYTAPAEQPRTELFMFAADGRKLLRLFGRFWAEEDMIALVTATGATQGLIEGPAGPADVMRVEPKALNWVEAHPWLSAFVITFGILVVIVVAVVLVFALG